MKKPAIYLMMSVLFFSCSMKNDSAAEKVDDMGTVGAFINYRVYAAIVDKEYNDRLNPDLPSYFGEEFTNGIEVLYLVNDRRLTSLEYKKSLSMTGNVENIRTIFPPYRYAPGYGMIPYGTLGNYFIDCSSAPGVAYVESVNGMVSHTYIRYPNGSEDEIKVEYWQNESGSIRQIGVIWVNGELAFNMMNRYYNPEYFPFLKPVLDDDGKQIEDWVMPETGDLLIWLVKSE